MSKCEWDELGFLYLIPRDELDADEYDREQDLLDKQNDTDHIINYDVISRTWHRTGLPGSYWRPRVKV